jgi:hypothetical protein
MKQRHLNEDCKNHICQYFRLNEEYQPTRVPSDMNRQKILVKITKNGIVIMYDERICDKCGKRLNPFCSSRMIRHKRWSKCKKE